MGERLWQRLKPGDDLVVEHFLEAQVDQVHRDLEAANDWHKDGRRYELDPPLPQGGSGMMFLVDEVEIRQVARGRHGTLLRTGGAVLAAGAALAATSLLGWDFVNAAAHFAGGLIFLNNY